MRISKIKLSIVIGMEAAIVMWSLSCCIQVDIEPLRGLFWMACWQLLVALRVAMFYRWAT